MQFFGIKYRLLTSLAHTQAYFFPPLNVSPYYRDKVDVITRLGLRSSTTEEEVKTGMKKFATDDTLYRYGLPIMT